MKEFRKKLIALLLIVICPLGLPAQEAEPGKDYPKKLEKLTTLAGEVFESVTVREVTPSEIRIIHKTGISSIPFEELSKDLQEKFGGFDPEKAAAYRSNKKEKYAEAMAIRKEKAKARKAAEHLKKEEAERIKKLMANKKRIVVEILRVLPDGVVANILEKTTTGIGSQRIGGGGGGVKTSLTRTNAVIYIEGITGKGATQRIAVTAAPDGVFTYETLKKEERTIEKWVLLEGDEKATPDKK